METPHFELAFEDFIHELQMAGLIKRNAAWLDGFRKKYHNELAFVCLYLSEIGALEGEPNYHPSPPSLCDICSSAIANHGFFVDGMTKDGSWANMCAHCYIRQGQGVGWGVGQLYQAVAGEIVGNSLLVRARVAQSADRLTCSASSRRRCPELAPAEALLDARQLPKNHTSHF